MDTYIFDCLIKKLEIAGVFYHQLIYLKILIDKQAYIVLKKLNTYKNDIAANEIAD